MKKEKLIENWLEEEAAAHIKGWDFSHIQGRYEEKDDLPWDYEAIVRQILKPDDYMLDIDTGGGEFLLSLHHPCDRTGATEGYPPNVQLCSKTLLPLGIDFKEADAGISLPFFDEKFDIVINRHGACSPKEICRVLKPGGIFITEQVGALNDRDLVELLYADPPKPPFPGQRLSLFVRSFLESGFTILDSREAFGTVRFRDIGALVWFARVIEWEFPDFSVQNNQERLFRAWDQLEKDGIIEGRTHRFLMTAQKCDDHKLLNKEVLLCPTAVTPV